MRASPTRRWVANRRPTWLDILRVVAFLAGLGGSDLATAKTIISRFCDPWLNSPSSTRVECACEAGNWNVRFDLKNPVREDAATIAFAEEGIVIAFSKEEESPLYCLEVTGLDKESEVRWDAQIRRNGGGIESQWPIDGVVVQKEGQSHTARELHISVPLHVLEPVYGKTVRPMDTIRVAFLRRTIVKNRPVWSSWRFFAEPTGSPWSPSAFGQLPISEESDRDFAWPDEPKASKTFRLAANQMRTEFRRYLDDEKLEEQTMGWYDRLGQFPDANPDWIVMDSQGNSDPSISSHQLPACGWMGLPFSLHARIAEEGAKKRGWKIEFAREDQTRGGWRMEWPGTGRSGIIRWNSSSGEASETNIHDAVVSFSLPNKENLEGRDFVMTYRGTGNLLDLAVYVDGVRASVSVLQQPAPWEFASESDSSGESSADSWVDGRTDGQVPWRLATTGRAFETIQVYRVSLTPIEAMGLLPKVPMVSWSEWSPEHRKQWTEHFAEREDRDGGYLLESLLHYSESAKRAARDTNASNPRSDKDK